MVSKDQGIGWIVCVACIATAAAYTFALLYPTLEPLRIWLVTIPVAIALIAIIGIGAWIGWTMATTPPPEPIEEIQPETT